MKDERNEWSLDTFTSFSCLNVLPFLFTVCDQQRILIKLISVANSNDAKLLSLETLDSNVEEKNPFKIRIKAKHLLVFYHYFCQTTFPFITHCLFDCAWIAITYHVVACRKTPFDFSLFEKTTHTFLSLSLSFSLQNVGQFFFQQRIFVIHAWCSFHPNLFIKCISTIIEIVFFIK